MEKSVFPLKPTRRVLVSDEVIEQIKNLILRGELKPGDPLPSEIKMASQMSVGRSTIREALKVLIHMGFIERRQKVAVVSEGVREKLYLHDIVDRFKEHRNILEMVEVRKIIEPDIASLAAMRRGPDDLELARRDVEAMSETIGDTEAFLMHDFRFHVNLALGSKNLILIEIARGMQEMLLETLRHIIRRSETIHPRSLDFHWKIFRAIEAEKPKLARKHMTDHLHDIEKEVYDILKRDNKKR